MLRDREIVREGAGSRWTDQGAHGAKHAPGQCISAQICMNMQLSSMRKRTLGLLTHTLLAYMLTKHASDGVPCLHVHKSLRDLAV